MASAFRKVFGSKLLKKRVLGNKLLRSTLRGAGGALVAALAWKIGEDIYEAVKRKLQEQAEAEEPAEEEEEA